MNKKVSVSGGIGFCGVLTIVFVVLKLIGVINWSWLWVLAPLWIEFVATIIICIIGFIVIYIIDKN